MIFVRLTKHGGLTAFNFDTMPQNLIDTITTHAAQTDSNVWCFKDALSMREVFKNITIQLGSTKKLESKYENNRNTGN